MAAGTKVGEAFVVVRPDTSGFEREAKAGIEGGLAKAFGAVATAAKVALVSGTAALAGLGAWGLKSAADMQQVEIAFEGILGSGKASKAFLDDLRAFAAKTPFEFPELARSAKMLLATGTAAEDVIPTMTRLGNVAATLGVGGEEIEGVVRALGQMQGKGKASAEELQQISEQIPGFSAIKAIAEGMGITTAEAFDKMADGAVSADDAVRFILEGMERFPGAAGAMERQAATLNGVLSTLKDTARDALITGLGPVLPMIAAAAADSTGAIGQALTQIGQTFGKLAEAAMPILNALLPVITTLAAAVGDKLVTVFDALAPVIANLGSALGPLVSTLGDALTPIIEALAPILVTVSRYIQVFFERIAQSGLLQSLGDAFGKLIKAAQPLVDMIGLQLLRVFDALSPVFPMIGRLLERLIPVIDRLLTAIEPLVEQIGDALVEAIESILPSLPALVDSLVQLLDAVIPLIPPFLQLTILWIQLLPVIAPLIALLVEGLAVGINLQREAVTWLAREWETAWNKIRDALTAAWEIVRPILEFMRDRLNDIAGAANFMAEVFEDAAKRVSGWATSLWEQVQGPLNDVWDILKKIVNAAKDVIDWIGKIPGVPGGGGIPLVGNPLEGLEDMFRASGGPVMAGRPYVVGEEGPELFFPGASGVIAPNLALAPSPGAVHFHFERLPADAVEMARTTMRTLEVMRWAYAA